VVLLGVAIVLFEVLGSVSCVSLAYTVTLPRLLLVGTGCCDSEGGGRGSTTTK